VQTIYSGWDWVLSRQECFLPLNTGDPFEFMSPGPGRPNTATTEMKRVEIAVNPELLDLFDAWWRSNHFPTRNEALRQILREKVDRAS
jgi:hypothetical protein